MRRASLWILVAIVVAGCSGQAASPAKPTSAPSASSVTTPAPIPSAAPAGTLVIAYEGEAQVELIPPSGHRVLVDVMNPGLLSRAPTADDILLTTHSHGDHYVKEFVDAFPGQKITISTGTINTSEIAITSILSAHDSDPSLSIDNYIFVMQIAGLKVVHFGDLGQDALTDGQLGAIGSVDVAISQLSNSFSSMYATNRKGVNLVNQVHPKLLMPTHMMEDTVATLKMAAAAWPTTWTQKAWIQLSPGTLPAQTTVVFVGENAKGYGKIAGSSAASW